MRKPGCSALIPKRKEDLVVGASGTDYSDLRHACIALLPAVLLAWSLSGLS